eukprot:2451980-Karenia_brevis.AAC.1
MSLPTGVLKRVVDPKCLDMVLGANEGCECPDIVVAPARPPAHEQLLQTVIGLRRTASMGILWESLPREGRKLLREEMSKQNIRDPCYLGGYKH